MKQTLLKPVQLNEQEMEQFYQTHYMHNMNVVNQSESFGMNTFNHPYNMNTFNYGFQYPFEYGMNQMEMENQREDALTFNNLQSVGLVSITRQQKNERIMEWLDSDSTNCLYPVDRY